MNAEEAVQAAIWHLDGTRNLSDPQRREAAKTLRLILQQQGCEAIAPEEGCDKLTDLIDVAVFG